MFDESPEDLAHLDAEIRDRYQPAGPTERLLVDTLVHYEWRLRRMRRVEAVLWQHAADAFLGGHPELENCNSADAFTTSASAFERLPRIVNACERNYHRALKELVARAHGLRNPQPKDSKFSSPNLASFRQTPDANPPAVLESPLCAANAAPSTGPQEPLAA